MDDIFDNHIDWQTERVYGPIPVAPQEDMPMPNEPMQATKAQPPAPTPGVKPLVSGAIPIRSPQEAAIETRDAGVSLVKGALQGFVGLPGDLEALLSGVINMANDKQGKEKLAKFLDGLNKDTILPTTEKLKKFVDSNSDYFKGLEKNPMQTVGEFLAPGGYVKAIKPLKPVAKALAPIAAGTAGTTTGSK